MNDNKTNEILKEILKTNEILEEILKWQILQGKKILRELIPKLLDDKNKKIVYEMTDGENTIRDIEKKINIDKSTISQWWNIWHSFGILEKEGRKYKKIISLKYWN